MNMPDPVAAQPIRPDESIDCIGLFCPMPIVKTREALTSMAVGQVLEMLSDDPASDADMKSWARRTGNELLAITRDGMVYRFLVRKVRSNRSRQGDAADRGGPTFRLRPWRGGTMDIFGGKRTGPVTEDAVLARCGPFRTRTFGRTL